MTLLNPAPSVDFRELLPDIHASPDQTRAFLWETLMVARHENSSLLAYQAMEACRQVIDHRIRKVRLDALPQAATSHELIVGASLGIELGDMVWVIRDDIQGPYAGAALFSAARVDHPWDEGLGDQRNAIYGLRDLAMGSDSDAVEYLLKIPYVAESVVAATAVRHLSDLAEAGVVDSVMIRPVSDAVGSGLIPVRPCPACQSACDYIAGHCVSCGYDFEEGSAPTD